MTSESRSIILIINPQHARIAHNHAIVLWQGQIIGTGRKRMIPMSSKPLHKCSSGWNEQEIMLGVNGNIGLVTDDVHGRGVAKETFLK